MYHAKYIFFVFKTNLKIVSEYVFKVHNNSYMSNTNKNKNPMHKWYKKDGMLM